MRSAIWKGDTPAIPAMATVEPNAGDTVRPKALIKSNRILMEIPAPKVAARFGINTIKEKNGASEPTRMANPPTKIVAHHQLPQPPRLSVACIAPIVLKANVSFDHYFN